MFTDLDGGGGGAELLFFFFVVGGGGGGGDASTKLFSSMRCLKDLLVQKVRVEVFFSKRNVWYGQGNLGHIVTKHPTRPTHT